MEIKDLLQFLDELAPFSYQEKWDNSGLICGNPSDKITGVLCSLDATEEIVEEAISNNCNVVVSHHPIVFSGLKSIKETGTYPERAVFKAIKNGVALIAIHTNFDKVKHGVNKAMCDLLNLKNQEILIEESNDLNQLTVLGKSYDIESIKKALFTIGVGKIGDYDSCSFTSEGVGTFRPINNANPTLGEVNALSTEEEQRADFLLPNNLVNKALSTAKEASSYEELAYFLKPISNKNQDIGYGMIGELEEAMPVESFLTHLKQSFDLGVVKYTNFPKESIKRIAVCGGSGSDFLPLAMAKKADVFITADYKYHQFFDADNKISIVDIGHYESEFPAVKLLYDYISENFSSFAVRLTGIVTNPVNYF